MSLTATQRKAAEELLATRPEVIPGTRVIVNNAQRKHWYAQVTDMMERLHVADGDTGRFCDIAGVPD